MKRLANHRTTRTTRTAWTVALIGLVATVLCCTSGCRLAAAGNPTPGAKPSRIGEVWVRHVKDKHDREAIAQVGFTLENSKHEPVAADGEVKVELKWSQGMMEYRARGSARVQARSFHQARGESGKPVRDGAWYTEPWNIYLIGQQYPGPSKHGYDVSLTFTSSEGRQLTWRRWASPVR